MFISSESEVPLPSENKISVLMFAGLYPPAYRGGGPIRTTFAIADTHSDTTSFRIITSDRDWGETEPLDVKSNKWTERDEARVWYARNDSLSSLLRAILSARADHPAFIYLNSFFSPVYSIFPALLFKLRLFGSARLIVAPRGEFGSAAQSYKSTKKKIFLKFCSAIKLHERTIWHASSEIEATDISRTFPESEVIVRINESTLPNSAIRYNFNPDKVVRLIFISRIAEIKGVSILLNALSGVDSEVSLQIYGPSDDLDYLEICHSLARALPDNIKVTFEGAVENAEVRGLFARSDAFFLPTEQENFGHAIAESLSAGCPVFIADVTPWSEVIRNGGGVIVPSRDPADWHEALAKFCSLSAEQRYARKLAAGGAYEEWRVQQDGPSIFQLASRQRLGRLPE